MPWRSGSRGGHRAWHPAAPRTARALLAVASAAALSCGHAPATGDSAAPAASTVPPHRPDELIAAAQRGDLAALERSIAAGAEPGAVDADGRSALMYAAFDGHTPVVRALLEAGAPIDRRDPNGRTALLYAATGPFPETVELLLERGADPRIADTGERFTALMHAAAEGHAAVVEVLLRFGADPSTVDVDGDSALDFARRNGHDAVVRLLTAATAG